MCAVFSAAEYTPPDVDGTDADAELRRVNTIVEMLIEGKRQVKNHPPPVKLAPVKPPSREHPEPEQDVQWDEFLTGALLFSLAPQFAQSRTGSATDWRLNERHPSLSPQCAIVGRLRYRWANRVARVRRPG